MRRREDWPERLTAEVERHDALPAEWGVSDCLNLPMDCVLAMTGEDPAAELRGSYSSEMGGAKMLAAHGWRSVADLFAAYFPEIPVALAGRGDIGVTKAERGLAGVVFVDTHAVGKHADQPGNIRVARSRIVRAFKVG